MDEKVRYWLDIAEYDLAPAEAMLKTGRYLYVGFMCHQVIEKILKAHYQMKILHETREMQAWIKERLQEKPAVM